MRIREYGIENHRKLLFLHSGVTPWFIFEPAAKCLARDYHVFLAAADGHDPEEEGDFISVEKTAEEAEEWLKARDITHLEAAYGACMGGSSLLRLLASSKMTIDRAVIDAAVTPYTYPKWICRLIAIKDFVMVRTAISSRKLIESLMPPERWTPEGQDAEEFYGRLCGFLKNHYSSRTVYNVFWSTNNYEMPEPVPDVDTEIEYWYGSEEKISRKNDIRNDTAYMKKNFRNVSFREFEGYDHLEMVMCHPEEFCMNAERFLGQTVKK